MEKREERSILYGLWWGLLLLLLLLLQLQKGKEYFTIFFFLGLKTPTSLFCVFFFLFSTLLVSYPPRKLLF